MPAAAPPVDVTEDLRLALRRLAKAVVLISASHADVRYVMAATAVSELSFDPPSLLICVNRSASLHAVLSAGADYGINILHSSQEHLSKLCTVAKGEARFEGALWESHGAVPVLMGAQANIVCRNRMKVDYGTHSIFIGDVVHVATSGEVDPLIYADQRYGRTLLG